MPKKWNQAVLSKEVKKLKNGAAIHGLMQNFLSQEILPALFDGSASDIVKGADKQHLNNPQSVTRAMFPSGKKSWVNSKKTNQEQFQSFARIYQLIAISAAHFWKNGDDARKDQLINLLYAAAASKKNFLDENLYKLALEIIAKPSIEKDDSKGGGFDVVQSVIYEINSAEIELERTYFRNIAEQAKDKELQNTTSKLTGKESKDNRQKLQDVESRFDDFISPIKQGEESLDARFDQVMNGKKELYIGSYNEGRGAYGITQTVFLKSTPESDNSERAFYKMARRGHNVILLQGGKQAVKIDAEDLYYNKKGLAPLMMQRLDYQKRYLEADLVVKVCKIHDLIGLAYCAVGDSSLAEDLKNFLYSAMNSDENFYDTESYKKVVKLLEFAPVKNKEIINKISAGLNHLSAELKKLQQEVVEFSDKSGFMMEDLMQMMSGAPESKVAASSQEKQESSIAALAKIFGGKSKTVIGPLEAKMSVNQHMGNDDSSMTLSLSDKLKRKGLNAETLREVEVLIPEFSKFDLSTVFINRALKSEDSPIIAKINSYLTEHPELQKNIDVEINKELGKLPKTPMDNATGACLLKMLTSTKKCTYDAREMADSILINAEKMDEFNQVAVDYIDSLKGKMPEFEGFQNHLEAHKTAVIVKQKEAKKGKGIKDSSKSSPSPSVQSPSAGAVAGENVKTI